MSSITSKLKCKIVSIFKTGRGYTFVNSCERSKHSDYSLI